MLRKMPMALVAFAAVAGPAWAQGDAAVVDTVASVRALAGVPPAAIALRRYAKAGDGGGGLLVYDGADTTSPDNGCTVFVDVAGHRWKRAGEARSINVRWCGAAGDGADATSAFQAAMAAAPRRGGHSIEIPCGAYRLSATISDAASYTTWRGEGACTVLLPTFVGPVFAIGDDGAGTAEEITVRDLVIAAAVAQTSGHMLAVKAGARLAYRNIQLIGCYSGVVIGDAGYALNLPGQTTLEGLRGGCRKDGVDIPGGASGTSILGAVTLGGVHGQGGRGVSITGPADGVYIDPAYVIADFDAGVYIGHSAGSAANIEIDANITTPEVAFVELDLTGSASVNNLIIAGGRWYDRTTDGDADGLLVRNAGTGPISSITITGLVARDIRRNLFDLQAPVAELEATDIAALDISAKAPGVYSGFAFGGQAHGHVVIANVRIGGGRSGSSRPAYGLRDGQNIARMAISNVDASDAAVAPFASMGPLGTYRKMSNLVGMAFQDRPRR